MRIEKIMSSKFANFKQKVGRNIFWSGILSLTSVAVILIGNFSYSGVIRSVGAHAKGLQAGSSAEQGIFWINNYARAIAQAKSTGKPIFLEFRCVP